MSANSSSTSEVPIPDGGSRDDRGHVMRSGVDGQKRTGDEQDDSGHGVVDVGAPL